MSKARIEKLKEQISNTQENIRITRTNTANHKANGNPKHYQESGRRKIKSQQQSIKQYKEEIRELKGNKPSSKRGSAFNGNILFLPFRILSWFIKLALKG
jgi:hypothetical protein